MVMMLVASGSSSLLLLSLVSVFNTIAIALDIYERAVAVTYGTNYPANTIAGHVLALGASIVMLGVIIVVFSVRVFSIRYRLVR